MSTVYLSTAYFAPVSYYASFLRYDRIVIEQWCNYTKQTYRNRCHIAGANGLLALSVPIVKPDTIKSPTKDIRISDHGEWLDFNEEIRRTVCNLIGIEPHIEYSSSYSEPAPGETDLRDAIHPKKRKAETILPVQPKPYYQVFSEKYGFQPDLSIIDLLMNIGPESILILQNT